MKALSGGSAAPLFNSYRLMLGEVGRSVAAYAGSGVYLDVALSWVAGTTVRPPPSICVEEVEGRRSGYSFRTLLSHFWRMVLTGGTRALRLVSLLGLAFALMGAIFAIVLVIRQLVDPEPVAGWTSLVVLVLICSGAILFSLGVIAEYIGIAVNMAMGKPALPDHPRPCGWSPWSARPVLIRVRPGSSEEVACSAARSGVSC